jgi:hypothetical protein
MTERDAARPRGLALGVDDAAHEAPRSQAFEDVDGRDKPAMTNKKTAPCIAARRGCRLVFSGALPVMVAARADIEAERDARAVVAVRIRVRISVRVRIRLDVVTARAMTPLAALTAVRRPEAAVMSIARPTVDLLHQVRFVERGAERRRLDRASLRPLNERRRQCRGSGQRHRQCKFTHSSLLFEVLGGQKTNGGPSRFPADSGNPDCVMALDKIRYRIIFR